MIKHLVALLSLIILSVVIIFATPYVQSGLLALLSAHDWIANTLKDVFTGGQAGDVTRQLIALLAIPLLAGLIPAFIYWLIKRKGFAYFIDFVWVTWLIQAVTLVVMFKVGA